MQSRSIRTGIFFLSLAIIVSTVAADEKTTLREQPQTPEPTEAEVSYGTHSKQVLSFWKVESEKPTPLVFFIHGGGWQAGNRMGGMNSLVPAMHKAGISVVSIEYRFIEEAMADGVEPPVLQRRERQKIP